MSLLKEARKYIISKFEESPKTSKEDLVELIRPHYIPDYPKLVEQDLGRLANYIASKVRDENGARQVFTVVDEGRKVLINVDKSTDLRDIKIVYDDLKKGRDSRECSIKKVLKRGQEVAGQLSLDFEKDTGNGSEQ